MVPVVPTRNKIGESWEKRVREEEHEKERERGGGERGGGERESGRRRRRRRIRVTFCPHRFFFLLSDLGSCFTRVVTWGPDPEF